MPLSRLRLPFLAVALATLTVGGCDLALDPRDDISGYYDYAGDVYDSPGFSVNGQLDISRPYSYGSEIDLDWNFYEGSRRVLHVETTRAVPAEVDIDGALRFTVEGSLQLSDGSWTDFRLTHTGRREDHRSLRGTWRLTTDLPSDDSGTFSARR
ncbi:MAG: hypothetical protein ABIV28_08955 [Longimicrobiales bacterium]